MELLAEGVGYLSAIETLALQAFHQRRFVQGMGQGTAPTFKTACTGPGFNSSPAQFDGGQGRASRLCVETVPIGGGARRRHRAGRASDAIEAWPIFEGRVH